MYKAAGLISATVLAWAVQVVAYGSEARFKEEFALADNRAKALEQLLPGSENYYFYHCLHSQNTGELKKVEELLEQWTARHGKTMRVEMIFRRQALLSYDKDPKKNFEFLKSDLNLTFDHQRAVPEANLSLPTRLRPEQVNREAFVRQILENNQDLRGIEGAALYLLNPNKLSPTQRRQWLSRLPWPDVPQLAQLVVEDLNQKDSTGFGALPIHRKLTLAQMEECLTLKPELRNEKIFVENWLPKLHPTADEDWQRRPEAREAFFDRLWAFVKTLAPAHNSLKANVLYHRLAFDRSKGKYDKPRFLEYLALPRKGGCIKQSFLERAENPNLHADLDDNFSELTLLPKVAGDEDLVRDFLAHFFKTETDFKPFAEFLDDDWLKRLFVETKIQNGLGRMEEWYSLLNDPAYFQQLTDRVKLEFAPGNKTWFSADELPMLEADVKNVPTLLVRIYEINALHYYQDKKKEMDPSVKLDGLTANEEHVFNYSEPPARLVRRRFDFPILKKPGVYVVELLGNGQCCRALIRKGSLSFGERCGAAGHVFTVFDETGRKLSDARIWLNGRDFAPDKTGEITIPYSTSPDQREIIVHQNDLAVLGNFQHKSENYSLKAGFFVGRETLLKGNTAQLLVRAHLFVNDSPVSSALLAEPELMITAKDFDGIVSFKTIRNFKLREDRDAVFEFAVPENLSSLTFSLGGQVKNISNNRGSEVLARQSFQFNQIHAEERTSCLFLSRMTEGYRLRMLGKTGESFSNCAVNVQFYRNGFNEPISLILRTDEAGVIELGDLRDVHLLRACGPDGCNYDWVVSSGFCELPQTLNGVTGEIVRLPYVKPETKPTRESFALFEMRGESVLRDCFAHLSQKDGYLEIQGLPPGNYELTLKEFSASVKLHVAAGEIRDGRLPTDKRLLEIKQTAPLQITAVETTPDNLVIRLKNAGKLTRVHVSAARYQLPPYLETEAIGAGLRAPEIVELAKGVSVYLPGEAFDGEARYILERKYAAKFPGNMLPRPSLLLNPWKPNRVSAIGLGGGHGGDFGHRGAGGRRHLVKMGGGSASESNTSAWADVSFLPTSGVLLTNLRPDENGLISLALKSFNGLQDIHIVAVDPEQRVGRRISLAETDYVPKDLRLPKSFDVAQRLISKRQISVLKAGQSLALSDMNGARWECFDTLGKVFELYAALGADPKLREFRFITSWPDLKPEEKRTRYSEHACHELNFFLSQKDPEFFRAVVRPYLKNKKDKTFLDRYLLDEDLSAHLQPWAHDRLNVIERILLGRRIPAAKDAEARHVRELNELLPPEPDRFDRLFQTALQSTEMTARQRGMESAEAKALEKQQADSSEKLENAEEARDIVMEAVPDERKARDPIKPFYRDVGPTNVWVENNYRFLSKSKPDLIPANAFWRDYAEAPAEGGFLSSNLAEPSRNFTEMIFALAVSDLPFSATAPETTRQADRLTITVKSPSVVFHQEIVEAVGAEKIPVQLGQNFFRVDDRYRFENREKHEKYVNGEFLARTAYGCLLVVTNTSPAPRTVDVLLQIPAGAMPVKNCFRTTSRSLGLAPYASQTLEYSFYFPQAGVFSHYPAQLSHKGKWSAAASAATFKVVEKLTQTDTTSWTYVSQNGTAEEVSAFLRRENVQRLELGLISWRMKDKAFFQRTLALLAQRRVFDETLWSYGVFHQNPSVAKEYLRRHEKFSEQCGWWLESPLLTLDPVEQGRYEHLEFAPLINPRAHGIERRPIVWNYDLAEQYGKLLEILTYKPTLSDEDRLAVTYFLLAQDRIEEGRNFFARIKPEAVVERLQFDYLAAYLDFFNAEQPTARRLAAAYKDYPVKRWQILFATIQEQLAEADGKDGVFADKPDNALQQDRLAGNEASFDFTVESQKVRIAFRNLTECRVNYYPMEIEQLFSSAPFAQKQEATTACIRPRKSDVIMLPKHKAEHEIELPAEFCNGNVLIEIVAGGMRKSQASCANSLNVQVWENYGQVKVTQAKTGKPLPKVYVKVYAQADNDSAQFHKDGYTDLRGRFDYASLNEAKPGIKKFALLILSETDGAVIREARIPER